MLNESKSHHDFAESAMIGFCTSRQSINRSVKCCDVRRISHSLAIPATDFRPYRDRRLNELANFTELSLENSQLTDASVEHLKQLTRLKTISVDYTQITDDGLEHFKGLNGLTLLSLVNTPTTEKGRSMLRQALPACKIEPDP